MFSSHENTVLSQNSWGAGFFLTRGFLKFKLQKKFWENVLYDDIFEPIHTIFMNNLSQNTKTTFVGKNGKKNSRNFCGSPFFQKKKIFDQNFRYLERVQKS